MQLTEIDNREFVNDITARLSKVREGIHLSDLEMCLKASFYRRVNPQPLTPEQAVMFSIGLGVQEYLYPGAEKSYTLDDIICSPDAKGIEVKTVRSHIKSFNPLDHPNWMWRTKGYCKVLGTTTFILDVIFVVSAQTRSWKLEFDQNEIDLMWEEAKLRRDILTKALATNTPPTLDFHPDWLCKKCEHAGTCWASKP